MFRTYIHPNAVRQIELNWPDFYLGWYLQVQTNSQTMDGLGTNWFTIPGSAKTNQAFIPINPANANSFFRLASPN
jgi:hypothetical protein